MSDDEFSFRARGTSMEPTIREGDLVRARPLGRRPVRPGEIVVFARDSGEGPRLVAHRIVEVRPPRGEARGPRLVEKGDGTRSMRGLDAGEVLGRVVAVLRPDGRVLALDSRAGRRPAPVLAFALRALGRFAEPVGERPGDAPAPEAPGRRRLRRWCLSLPVRLAARAARAAGTSASRGGEGSTMSLGDGTARHRAIALGALAVLGALLGAGAYRAWPMGWVLAFLAPVPILFALVRLARSGLSAAATGFLAGGLFFAVGLGSLAVRPWIKALLLPGGGLIAVPLALFVWRTCRGRPERLLPAVVLGGATLEFALSWTFLGVLSPAMLPLAGCPAILAGASIGGTPWVAGLYFLGAGLLTRVVLALADRAGGARGVAGGPGAPGAWYGAWPWGAAGAAALLAGLLLQPGPGSETVRVALLGPGGVMPTVSAEEISRSLNIRLELLTPSEACRDCRWVVWPEAAVQQYGGVERERLAAIARRAGRTVVVGVAEGGREGWFNRAYVIAPDRGILGVYQKRHPAWPLGEDSEPGAGVLVVDRTVGVAICYDLYFEDVVRESAAAGARAMVVPAWTISPKVAEWLLGRVPALRAAESGLPVLVADHEVPGVAFDGRGRRLRPVRSGAGVTVYDAPLAGRTSLYAAGGHRLRWLFPAAFVVWWLALARRRRPPAFAA